jgi:hypothetical protein
MTVEVGSGDARRLLRPGPGRAGRCLAGRQEDHRTVTVQLQRTTNLTARVKAATPALVAIR